MVGVAPAAGQVQVVRVVVASPGDVQAEPDLVSVIAREINQWIGSACRFRLEVARWKTDAYPGFHPEGPQGLIDPILRIEDCDLLVAIFWRRLGTPAHDGRTGTEHEFHTAYEAWKASGRPQMFVYFNQKKPSAPDDEGQLARLLEFRKSFPPEGLFWEYSGALHFERLFRSHLFSHLRERFLSGHPQPFPALPPPPGMLFGRDEALQAIRTKLLDPRHPVVIVRGWPGIGKSTVVAALAHDAETRQAYPDGVLWTSLGIEPSVLSSIVGWGQALGSDELLKAHSLQDATAQLAALLRHRRMLLLVDDVWEADHVVSFQQARGPRCGLLVTTRETRVAEALVRHDDVYNLPVLSEDSSLEILGALAPSVVDEDLAGCRALVRDLEYLPLALHVAGRLLAAEAKYGWGVQQLLAELREGSKVLESKAPADRADVARQTIPTVAVLLERSTNRLEPSVRDCFASLAPFAPKPATFDLDALKAVWQTTDPRPVVRELVSRGLLEPVGGRFQMHALLVAHARALLKE